jgi:hypothetical protein
VAADFASCKSIPVSSGTFTITLVASTSQPASGQCILILNYGSGAITVAANGQNINGSSAAQLLAAGSASAPTGLLVISDGTNYVAQPFGAAVAGSGSGSGTGSGLSTLNHQQNLAPVTLGSGTDQTLFTYTLPANTLGSGGCINLTMGMSLSGSANGSTFKLFFGSASQTIFSGWTVYGIKFWPVYPGSALQICNNAGATNAQTWAIPQAGYNTSGPFGLTWTAGFSATTSIDTTSPVVIKLTASDSTALAIVTPDWWTIR